MRNRWLVAPALVAALAVAHCSDSKRESPRPVAAESHQTSRSAADGATPHGAAGQWTQAAAESLDRLAELDPKTQAAETQCATARTMVRTAERRSETGIAPIGEKVERICLVSDAWASLLRALPKAADETLAMGVCEHAKSLIRTLDADGTDLEALKKEYGARCASHSKLDAVGELGRLEKLDPRSARAIAICSDAQTEAAQATIHDEAAGAALSRRVDAVCGVPLLWSSLQFAADDANPKTLRDQECIGSMVWIRDLSRSKALAGKQLAAARREFRRVCRAWKNADPLAALSKLGNMDPKSPRARELCVQADAFAAAHRTEDVREQLERRQLEACAEVRGWFHALESHCALARDRFAQVLPHLAAEDAAAMKTALEARCP